MPTSKKHPTVYAFIDSQNLNLGTLGDIHKGRKKIHKGWRLDYRKFRKFLKDKYRVKKAFLFIGYIPENKQMYKSLESYGYELIFKPTVKDKNGRVKGNVDAELVLHASAIEYNHYDKAVVVTGDGDFGCLIEFLLKQNKLLLMLIPNRFKESSLLKKTKARRVYVQDHKTKLEL